MKAKDLSKACNLILDAAFPEYQVYGNDTYDGYTRPAFFTELLAREMSWTSKTTYTVAYTYKITFLETTHSEVRCLEIIDEVKDAFGMSIKTDSGIATVEEIDFSWIDSNNDVLQMTIDFASVRTVKAPDIDAPLMEVMDADVIVNYYFTDFDRAIKAIKKGKVRFRIQPDGRFKLYDSETSESYVMIGIVGLGRYSDSVLDELEERARFYLKEDGQMWAEVTRDDRIVERFRIYVG